MYYLINISVFLGLSASALLLQVLNVFQIGTINPNLFLIVFASFLVFYKRKDFWIITIPTSVGLIAWSLLSFPFWIWELVIIAVILILSSLIKTNFTGNKFIDTSVVVGSATILFYLVSWISGINDTGFYILGELLYNLVLTIPICFIVKSLKKNTV